MKMKDLINKIIWQICSLDKRADIARKFGVCVGDECKIYRDVSFGSEPYLIKLGNKVRVTSGVRFITHDGGMFVLRNMNKIENGEKFNQIIVGNNVHIGMNAIIMPNVKIGDNVVIGAGAVVTKNIPSNSVAAGVPAKIIRTIEEYYEKNIKLIDNTKHMSAYDKKEYLINKFTSNNI